MRRGSLTALLLAMAGCQAGPLGPRTLSLEAEALAGRRAAPSLEQRFGGVEADPAAEVRMARLGRQLVRNLPDGGRRWRYAVLSSEEINAFSLSGGLIYVTRGLYRRIGSDDQLLMAVLAHEMSHVIRQDSLKPPLSDSADRLAREIEADAGAAALLLAAGASAAPLDRLLALTADVQSPAWVAERRARLMQAAPPQ